ncbi:MAG: hypothetical protein IH971_04480 [Candidatus Marinimicrobia bacterium]|nr:hypothetical protein [Candidatus Neomarinimicrobiota bacterium]
MKKKMVTLFSVVALGGSVLWGQVTVQEIFFNDFVTFYVSSVDVSTGSQNVELFELEILVDEPVTVEIEFTLTINSFPLGLTFDDEFLTVTVPPFTLQGPVRLRNTELDVNTTQLFYSGPPGGAVDIPKPRIVTPDLDELENMQSLIMQTGRLPDGTYRFALEVRDPGGAILAGWSKEIISAHPVALELISPGGVLEDTTNTAITTTYPFFQWESDPCAFCSYQIRVAKYIVGEHSSLDDAIEDQTVWPLEQALGFFDVGNATSVPYPLTGAVDLEPGGIYVWQVQKVIPTTSGEETVNSFIWALKIDDPTQVSAEESAGGPGAVTSPIMTFLQSVMGTESFEQAFSAGGELDGFSPNRVLRRNGEALSLDQLNAVAIAIQQGAVQVITVEVQ